MAERTRMDARDVLIEAFDRLPALVKAAVQGLTPEQLHWTPAPDTNSIGWLVWHLTRVQDDHVADLIDGDQIWLTGCWEPRFGLPSGTRETGYGHTPPEAASVRPQDADVLTDYYAAVSERTMRLLHGLRPEDFDRVIDRSWNPPVTMGVRLVSVVNDDTQHVGQAAYLRGLGERLGFPTP